MEKLPLAAFSSVRIFFSVGRTMRLEYVIKCELFTRKWHVMKRSNLAKWNLIGDTIQAREKLPDVHEVQ